jgi:CRISPR-associated exonuclease Cas4
MLVAGRLPPPVNDARCRECSLREICQPEALAERNWLARLVAGFYDVDEAEISR